MPRQKKKISSLFGNRRLVRRIAGAALATVTIITALFFLLLLFQVFGPVPQKGELKNIRNHLASEIVASGGEMLGKYFLYDRTNISLSEVSPHVINALISTEDVRFYRHKGLDMRSFGRVLIKSLLLRQRSAGGGSTITMQLARNLYPRNKSGKFMLLADKLRETVIARRLERLYSKDELLLLYLNTVSFGDNVFGISAASHRFFNKPPALLKAEEASVLVGMLKATTAYNPRLHHEQALERRNTVIDRLRRHDHISPEMADSLKAIPLKLDYAPVSHIHGPAPYFREWVRHQLVQLLRDHNERHGTSYNLYTDGLTITTTIDYHLQVQAEASLQKRMQQLQKRVDQHYRNVGTARNPELANQLMKRSERYSSLVRQGKGEAEIREIFNQAVSMTVFDWNGEKTLTATPLDSMIMAQKQLHAALVSIEPETGHIRAWVGGNDFRYFKYDHVLSARQAGSAFKPLVFAAALEHGILPCEYISCDSIVFPDYNHWSPANADRNYVGYYSMKGALQQSVNTVAVRYLIRTGTGRITDLARRAGIKADIPQLPSLALGTLDCSLLELTAAYGIFTSAGNAPTPEWLLKIESAEGHLIFEKDSSHLAAAVATAPEAMAWSFSGELMQDQAADGPGHAERVISAENSMIMTEMLREVTRSGTAAVLSQYISPAIDMAGKTGTTQNNADAWFIGYTPGLITGVWVGAENPVFTSMYPLPFGASGSAVLVWGDYVRDCFSKETTRHWVNGSFDQTPVHLREMMECEDYLAELPSPGILERIRQILEDRTDEEKRERPQRLRKFFRRILDEIL